MQIVGVAPHRISLFGGGTDVEPYASNYGGEVINLAINLYTKVFIKPMFGIHELNGRHTGLGSSASYFVALVAAISEHFKLNLSTQQIAEAAFKVETETLGWYGGRQDQYAAAFGGFNRFKFGNSVEVEPLPREWIENFLPYMNLFDTNMKRNSFNVQNGFRNLSETQIAALEGLKKTTTKAIKLFKKEDYEGLGDLLDEVWEMKKASNNVTNKILNAIYILAKRNGAIGGKLIGAGQGGHFLFIAKPANRDHLIKEMEDCGLRYVPFGVDWKGVRVVCEH